ncbi:glycosyltransferase [Tenacibaculum holothuriorum]|uniref:Glycosyltransferase n=1 Tax=Tenacibaculum holothuriorum TaxID=1635173 RepID=A0A1Y2PEP8_9FLAO|nr:glycosyltransferase family 2 protein [Tenacibaculum holothuriorum]OSY88148.1 glycosyltransferase [Tenacibaculum holothuriorum]
MNVTIAIPFYNAEKFLPDAIKSVFAQTHKEWELLLIDDGSSDNSLAIANSVKDSRVKVFSDGKNKKLAGRLNEVTKMASYDFIVRMDADDLMMPNRVEKLVKIIKENKVDIVTSGVYSVLNDLSVIGVRGDDYDNASFKEILTKRKGVTHAALIARKEWYKRNIYDENLSVAQDLDLWLRSSKRNDLKIISISEPLYIYREENNVTTKKLLKAYKNERRMIRKYVGHYSLLIFKSYLKSIVVSILSVFGKVKILQKNRSKKEITQSELKLYKEAIKIIKETKVDGLR